MTEDNILDDLEEHDPKSIQEPFAYRMLLTLLWLIWSVWSFYDGTIRLEIIRENSSNLSFFIPHRTKMVYEYYIIGILTLGMAIIIFKKSEDRISYLFSFVGIMLFFLLDLAIDTGALIVFVPMLIFLFLERLGTSLVCYILSSLLFVLILSNTFARVEYLFITPNFFLFYALIFMSLLSYRRILFPLNNVIIKLRYRLYTLLGVLPFILEHFFL